MYAGIYCSKFIVLVKIQQHSTFHFEIVFKIKINNASLSSKNVILGLGYCFSRQLSNLNIKQQIKFLSVIKNYYDWQVIQAGAKSLIRIRWEKCASDSENNKQFGEFVRSALAEGVP